MRGKEKGMVEEDSILKGGRVTENDLAREGEER